DETPDDLINWIEDNVPKDYAGAELADAYYNLSNADRWLGRVRATQNYSYWRYAGDAMTAGVAAARCESKGEIGRASCRERNVTGVQTCALPISTRRRTTSSTGSRTTCPKTTRARNSPTPITTYRTPTAGSGGCARPRTIPTGGMRAMP